MTKAWRVVAAAVVVAAAPRSGGRQVGDEPITVSAVRFYAAASATTTIEGVCEVRLGTVASGGAPVARYRVEVSILDSAGLELQKSGWSRELPSAVAGAPHATAVETFEFRVAPGQYRVVVRAIPLAGPVAERAVTVSGYATAPALSDLLLATSVRVPATDTAPVAAGEILRGGLVMRTAPVPRLSPTEASLSYYAEVYPWQGAAADGELRVAVLSAGGGGRRTVIQTAPRPVQVGAAGGAVRGSLDLAGLPEGEYALQLRVRLGDSTVVAEAPFSMRPLSAVVAAAQQEVQAADRFEAASEAALDSMYAPLVYLLQPREQGVYERLTLDGKRRFLRQFWERRDATRGTGVNQTMEQFYRAVGFANSTFREGGAGQIPGWRTDRGRIYLKNGRWDDILQRPMASPKPYEVWKYTRGRERYYVFLDQSGLGHYQLIGTNDRRESGLPNWEQLLDTENYTDVVRFLGLAEQQP